MSAESSRLDPTRTAIGTWSGGRFMHFGEPLDDARYQALITPDAQIPTVLTADAYGAGEADTLLGRALDSAFAQTDPDKKLTREQVCVVGAVGHDFYAGERDGAKGFPRFTDTRLRGPEQYASYLKMATERSLERCGIDQFDVLLLHNPDRTGYTSETVWDGMQALKDADLTRRIGVAPGPANGFTLDLIDCFERFGDRIDWAMVILNPLEPWPGELCLDAAASRDINVITRVVDYGGLFFDDLLPDTQLGPHDHRSFRPAGLDRGRAGTLRAHAPDRAGRWPDDDPTRLPVEPRPPGGSDGCADARAGGRSQRPSGRAQARRAGGAAERAASHARGCRDDPRDRRQHRLDGAQGREPELRRRRAPRRLGARRPPRRRRPPLEHRSRAGPRQGVSAAQAGWPAGPPACREPQALWCASTSRSRLAARPVNSIGTRTTSSIASGNVQLLETPCSAPIANGPAEAIR